MVIRKMADVKSKRSTRADRAAQTRLRMVRAAYELFTERGYQATTLTALARRAGVSQQTIYNSVGGKAAVLKAVYDVQLAGDDDPIAMTERPEFRAVQSQRSRAATLRAYAALSRMITGRVGSVLGAVFVDGAASDAELRAGRSSSCAYGSNRWAFSASVNASPAHDTRTEITRASVDAIWTLTAPEIADRLVRRCQWSLNDYETWLAHALISGLRPRH